MQGTRLRACEPSHLQNKEVRQQYSSKLSQKNWSQWPFDGQPEITNSKVSNRTTRASLGSKMNEKVQTARGKYPKSCSNN